jgi:hypothetical protein
MSPFRCPFTALTRNYSVSVADVSVVYAFDRRALELPCNGLKLPVTRNLRVHC